MGKVKSYIRSRDYKFFVGVDPNQQVMKKLKAELMPTTIIVDEEGNTWYISIVGGPGVGAIVLGDETSIESSVEVGKEIATFLLGSTCCIASPIPVTKNKIGDQVFMGKPLQ